MSISPAKYNWSSVQFNIQLRDSLHDSLTFDSWLKQSAEFYLSTSKPIWVPRILIFKVILLPRRIAIWYVSRLVARISFCLNFYSTKNITLPPQESLVCFPSHVLALWPDWMGVSRSRRWGQIESASRCPWWLITILKYLPYCACKKKKN